MHAKVKFFDDFDLWQKFARHEIQPMKYLISAGVVVLLVVAWVLTNPLIQWHDRLVDRNRDLQKTH